MSELPENWTTALIGDVIEFAPKNNVSDNAEAGFVPLHLMGKRFLDKHGFEKKRWSEIKKGYTHFADGDVLLARITPSFENGKGGIAQGLPNGIGAGSTEYFVCRPIKELLHPKYLLALFKTDEFLKDGARVMQGAVGQQRVPKQYVLEHEILLPPLPEQKRIADKLDTLLTRVDSCQSHLERVPQILKRFRQSVLAAATSGRLTEGWREEKGISIEDWDTKTGKEIFPFVTSGSRWWAKYYSDSGSIFIRVGNLDHDTIELDLSNIQYVTPPDDAESKRTRVQIGDILISITADVGMVGYVQKDIGDAYTNQHVCIARQTGEYVGEFLAYYLASPVGGLGQLTKAQRGATKAGLTLGDIRELNIQIPSLEEQAEIVRRVETLFAFADRLETRYATGHGLVEQFTPSLLAKAFRGELVKQDPNDESASALVERIREAREAQKASSTGKKPSRKKDRTAKARSQRLSAAHGSKKTG